MPTTQVELDHRDESLGGIVNLGHWQEGLGMSHETAGRSSAAHRYIERSMRAHFVILSNIDLGSKKNVGSVTLLRSAPGRS